MNRIPSVSLRGDAAEAGAAPAPDPAALARWARAFCIIRFDLERGQLVEACFPPDALAHGGLDRLVAFSYFPDSMSHHLRRHRSSVHDSLFSFRVPDPSPPAAGSRRGFLYGFVFNRQRQDERLPRGGEQKSVVILSHAPYSSLFRLLLQIIGPLCFDIGHTALTMVASHVAAWPAPSTVVPHGAPHWQRRAAGAPSARDRRPWAAACAVAGEPLGAVSENYDTTGREFSTCVSWLQILLASDLGVRGGELRHHWKGVLLHETLKILLGHI